MYIQHKSLNIKFLGTTTRRENNTYIGNKMSYKNNRGVD